MTATINTDASFYVDYKLAAYAFWITTDKGRIKKAAALKGEVFSANEAEFKCIVNALHSLANAKLGQITTIYINTDSDATIKAIETGLPPQWARAILPYYKKYIDLLGANIVLRHVKSHEHTSTPRNWVNDWCDKMAKKIAKEELKKRFNVVFGKKKK
jgi:ribonuclease HI